MFCPRRKCGVIDYFWSSYTGDFYKEKNLVVRTEKSILIHTGVAVTAGTLSMASVSLIRFFLIHYPISQENKSFHQRTRRLLLFAIWFLSLSTSAPLLFVRSVDTYSVAGSNFDFCLEHWSSPWMRKLFSYVIFTTVYVIPSAILLYCHLKVGFLIKSYEKTVFTSDRLASRRSFNRRGFRVKSSQGSNSSRSDGHPTGHTLSSRENQEFLNFGTMYGYDDGTKNTNLNSSPREKRETVSVADVDGSNEKNDACSLCEGQKLEETKRKMNDTMVLNKLNGHKPMDRATVIAMDMKELRDARRSRRLNHKRKQVRIIAFSLVRDVEPIHLFLSNVSIAL